MEEAGRRGCLGAVAGLYRDLRDYISTKLKETRICLCDIPASSVQSI